LVPSARLLREGRAHRRRKERPMFGLGILGTILLIVIILWLLGVIG
jgi:hypothetical protein